MKDTAPLMNFVQSFTLGNFIEEYKITKVNDASAMVTLENKLQAQLMTLQTDFGTSGVALETKISGNTA